MPLRPSLHKSYTTNQTDLRKAIRAGTYDQQSQGRTPLNRGMLKAASTRGNMDGDTTIRLESSGNMTLSVYDAKGGSAKLTLPSDISGQLSFKTGTAAPTIADYPNEGDNGQFYDTVASQLWITRNFGGALIYPNFVSIAGTISDAQHGDRSTTTTTMHKFSQISGSITAAQHGALTTTTASHQNATTSDAGFMSSADKTKLDNAVSTATASRLVIRDASAGAAFGGTLTAASIDASGTINTDSHFRVDATQVVTNRQAAIADSDGTLADTARAVNDWLAAARTHGLIAT